MYIVFSSKILFCAVFPGNYMERSIPLTIWRNIDHQQICAEHVNGLLENVEKKEMKEESKKTKKCVLLCSWVLHICGMNL
jgi:hypothetical protein